MGGKNAALHSQSMRPHAPTTFLPRARKSDFLDRRYPPFIGLHSSRRGTNRHQSQVRRLVTLPLPSSPSCLIRVRPACHTAYVLH